MQLALAEGPNGDAVIQPVDGRMLPSRIAKVPLLTQTGYQTQAQANAASVLASYTSKPMVSIGARRGGRRGRGLQIGNNTIMPRPVYVDPQALAAYDSTMVPATTSTSSSIFSSVWFWAIAAVAAYFLLRRH